MSASKSSTPEFGNNSRLPEPRKHFAFSSASKSSCSRSKAFHQSIISENRDTKAGESFAFVLKVTPACVLKDETKLEEAKTRKYFVYAVSVSINSNTVRRCFLSSAATDAMRFVHGETVFALSFQPIQIHPRQSNCVLSRAPDIQSP